MESGENRTFLHISGALLVGIDNKRSIEKTLLILDATRSSKSSFKRNPENERRNGISVSFPRRKHEVTLKVETTALIINRLLGIDG